jgi:hypothetical protein
MADAEVASPMRTFTITEQWLEKDGEVFLRTKVEGGQWQEWTRTPYRRIPLQIVAAYWPGEGAHD